jgi:hypothetical protein
MTNTAGNSQRAVMVVLALAVPVMLQASIAELLHVLSPGSLCTRRC